jgi:deoxyribonuclease IV
MRWKELSVARSRTIGAHLSIAGGLYKAVEAAVALSMDTVQIFTHSPQSWSVTGTEGDWLAKTLSAGEISDFRTALKSSGLAQPVAHDSYLINLASHDDRLWEKSIAAFTGELLRAEALGLLGVVMHPGAATNGDVEAGLDRVAQALDRIHRATAGVATLTLLETTAGQGSCLGHRFEHLGEILKRVATPGRVGVCVDTCHIFAAGYAIGSATEFQATLAEFDEVVGLDQIRAFHLNDSLKPFGSRVDRHAAIGRGCLGLEPFRLLLNEPRFARVPMFLETPKGDENGEELDAINLRTLRGLIGQTEPIAPAFQLEAAPAKKAAKKTARKATQPAARKTRKTT